jgi:hypothetical protein
MMTLLRGDTLKLQQCDGELGQPQIQIRTMTSELGQYQKSWPTKTDSSTRFFIEQALNVAEGYAHVFS